MDEVAALPSPRVLLSRRLERYYGRLRRPPGSPPTSRLLTGYRARRSDGNRSPGRVGPPQFPPPPSERSAPHTPGGSSGLHSRLFTPSLAFALTTRPVTRPSRQPATGPPGSYPGGTHTRRRRRAYVRIRSPHQPPPNHWAHVAVPAKRDSHAEERFAAYFGADSWCQRWGRIRLQTGRFRVRNWCHGAGGAAPQAEGR